MAVVLDKIRFTDEYTGILGGFGADTGTDFLMGSVGDKMWVKLDFHIDWHTLDQPMTFNAADNSIIRNDFGSFLHDEFSAGDSIAILNAGSNDGNYIIESVTETEIVTTSSLDSDGSFAAVSIYGTTPIDKLNIVYYFNLIANSKQENLQSLSDPNIQKYQGVLPVIGDYVFMKPVGQSKAWDDPSDIIISKVDTYGYPTYNQYFTILQTFYIKPFYLNGQKQALLDLLNEVNITPPEYFSKSDCLKFIYKIDAKYSNRDPKVYHTSNPDFNNGNVGWFNELLNGVPIKNQAVPIYNLISTEYFDHATGYPVEKLDFKEKTDVVITVQIPTGAVTASSKTLLNFMWMPNSNLAYQNKNTDFRHLFLHDRASTIPDDSNVNGDRFGTPYQVITDYNIIPYSDQLIIQFTADFGSLVSDTFEDNTYGRDYMIWVTPQDVFVETLETTNRVAVLADVNTATTDTDDDTLLVIDTDGTTDVHFFQAPDSDANPYTNVSGFIGEYWNSLCRFKVKSGCTIKNINVDVEVQVLDSGGDLINTFQIESWNNVTNSFYNGTFTDIGISSNRNFFLPSDSPFNQRSISTYPDLDGGGYYGYELNYGFQLGYAWWNTLNDYAIQYENYRNQYWAVFTQNKVIDGNAIQIDGGSASIKFIITWDILDNSTGITTEFIHTADVSVYDDHAGYDTEITTQDAIFGDDMSQQVADDIQTQVTAVFTGTNLGIVPTGKSMLVEFALYYEDGSINRYDRVTNVDDPLDGSLWINTPDITINSANQVTATATLNIDKQLISRIYARIGNTTSGLHTDDDVQIQTDYGIDIIVD